MSERYLIDLIAGARPNFMKISPIINAIKTLQKKGSCLQYRLVHTGQHYDQNMSQQFFEQLGIPEPDVNLGAGGGTQAEQTSRIMLAYEKLLQDSPCELCLVVGDVNSTMACSITAKKMNTPVAHVEAGIRSYDLNMPEEINRMVTDSITDYFFTTTQQASDNLKKCGIPDKRIFLVGNTMIDTLLKLENDFRQPQFWSELNLREKEYFVLTLHRPSNVDNAATLTKTLSTIDYNTRGLPVLFPVHPRTNKMLERIQLDFKCIKTIEPLGYLEFNYLVKHAKAVITDSGGITEETTVLGVPCMTLRTTTERPETVEIGTNELLGTSPHVLVSALDTLFSDRWKKGQIPPLWDGQAAIRIASILEGLVCSESLTIHKEINQ